jgi:hypothetical protein
MRRREFITLVGGVTIAPSLPVRAQPREQKRCVAHRDRIRDSAIELVGLKPDVILASAPLQRQTNTIPIVFNNIADPVSSGFVASLAHPGGNITGFSPSEFSVYGKLLGLLKEVVPNLMRVAVIMNPEQVPQAGMMHAIEAAAHTLAVKTERFLCSRPPRAQSRVICARGKGRFDCAAQPGC